MGRDRHGGDVQEPEAARPGALPVPPDAHAAATPDRSAAVTPDAPASAGPPGASTPATPDEADAGRRAFFRSLSREAIQAAAQVAGTAMALQRGTNQLTGELLGLGLRSPEASAALVEDRLGGGQEAGSALRRMGASFHSPYRVGEDELVLLDQRSLPQQVTEIHARGGAEVAAAMRWHSVRGAPLLGQVAAYGLWLAAERSRDQTPFMRAAMIRGTRDAMRLAREGVAAIGTATDRVLARWYAVGEHADGAAVAEAIRAEADAIAMEAALDHGQLVRHGLELLPGRVERPLRILTLDETGPLGSGLVGTALGIVQALPAQGQQVAVWALEGWPDGTGRLTAWQLGLRDIPCIPVADAGVGPLLAEGLVDVVLVGAERIAADGSWANSPGTHALARLAAHHGVPCYVCAPTAAYDARYPDAASLRPERRRLVAATQQPPTESSTDEDLMEVTVQDVTPAELATAYVTEEGVARPPFGPALAAHRAAADARHPTPSRQPTDGRPETAVSAG